MHGYRLFTPAAVAAAALFGGCVMQHVPPNPLDRRDLPTEASSGIIVSSHGHQAGGFKAAWKENGRVYILSEATRLGPREESPFGIHPTDGMLTVLSISPEQYDRIWWTVYNHNLWYLGEDAGIIDSEITFRTFAYHQVLLWNDEKGGRRFRRGTHIQSTNSPIFRDTRVKMWDQGLELLDRFFRGADSGRPAYLIREDGKVHEIPVEPASEVVLSAELKDARPQRRAAAAALLGDLGATNDLRAGLEALLDVLDAGEKDDNVRRYMIWAVGNLYPRFTELVDKRTAGMADKVSAEQLRNHLTREYPESVLRLGSATEKK
jgi:hypothetical protein